MENPHLSLRIPIDQDVAIERYLTAEAIRLGLSGFAAGSLVGVAWRIAGRLRWGLMVFVTAVLVGAGLTGRSDWPRWDAASGSGAILSLLAGAGTARLLAEPAIGWPWVAVGALISAGGVWAGVPETGPALLVGGTVAGLAVAAALTRSQWERSAGMGVAAGLGWAALSGAAGRPWAALGGALCFGVAPWFALIPASTMAPGWARRFGLLGGHIALVALAARWIGVDPHAGWARIAVVAVVGMVLAMTVRRKA